MKFVISAVVPELPFTFKIKCWLTVTLVFTIPNGHYKVDRSTDLYHQSINISQEQRETNLNFVFCAVELKKRKVSMEE